MNIGSAVFAGLMLAVGLVYESMALNMPRGTLAYPGPGLFPLIIGVFMVAMALGCLLQEIVPRKREKKPEASSLPSADAADPRRAQRSKNLSVDGAHDRLHPRAQTARISDRDLRLPRDCDPHLRLPQVAAHAGDGGRSSLASPTCRSSSGSRFPCPWEFSKTFSDREGTAWISSADSYTASRWR